MSRRLTIQPEATDEACDAHDWYDERQAGLGAEFYRELTRTIEFIMENPMLSPVAYRGLRKRKLDRFPYLVIYQASESEISVVSVFHGSRHPAVWKKRA